MNRNLLRAATGRLVTPLLLFAAALAMGGCEDDLEPIPDSPGRAFERSLESGGVQRSYQLWVATSLDLNQENPIIIALHGANGSGSDMRAFAGFDQAAPALGMFVAYPDALASDWNEDCGCTAAEAQGIDDVQFIRDMLDHIEADYRIDRSAIYVAGFSQGGLFAENLVCKMGQEVAAAAVVAATLSRPLYENCEPSGPVPFLLIHGTEDAVFPPEGTGSGNEEVVSIDTAVEFWKSVNGCADPPVSQQVLDQFDDQTSITVSDWESCDPGGEVEFYEVLGGGHTWPSRSVTFPQGGLTSLELVAGEEIGLFFVRN